MLDKAKIKEYLQTISWSNDLSAISIAVKCLDNTDIDESVINELIETQRDIDKYDSLQRAESMPARINLWRNNKKKQFNQTKQNTKWT